MHQGTIAGNLGADPEVRFTASGQKVTTLRLAARVRRKKEDKTVWWRATIWGDLAEGLIAHLKKGSSIIVTGEIDPPEIYNDRDGKPRISLGITAWQVMFAPSSRPPGAEGAAGQQGQGAQSGGNEQAFAAAGRGEEHSFQDEELPF